MTKIIHFLPASEEGHFNGLVDEGKYLRQSLFYKQILLRTQSRPKTIFLNPTKKTSCLSVFVAKTLRNLRNLRLIKDLSLYNCRDTFTNVMSALQINLFMQNKAKFKKVKLNVNKVLTEEYEQLDTWSIRKKQSQTKPKRTQFKANSNPIQSQYEPNSNPIYPIVASGQAGTNPIYTPLVLFIFYNYLQVLKI